MRRLIFTAAHGGFSGLGVPLGGGATISEWLVADWHRARDVEVELITPSILGARAPSGRDIAAFNERDYARFCIGFSQAATRRILAEDPSQCTVLVNDIAEAPDFARLVSAGFRIVTIYHVDVVGYIAAIYCKGRVSAATLARAWELVRPVAASLAPSILKLIFERQRDSLNYSHRVVVPSSRMKTVLLHAYPGTPEDRIDVVPWGVRREQVPEAEVAREVASIRHEYGLDSGRGTVVCLSRISPEKGQDLLLEGLIELERQGAFRDSSPDLLVCGAPAFMRGRVQMDLLRKLSARLARVRVHFPGHVTGARKLAMSAPPGSMRFPPAMKATASLLQRPLRRASPRSPLSRPAAGEILDHGQGVLVRPGSGGASRFASEVAALLADQPRRDTLGALANQWAQTNRFENAAARIAAILGF